MFTIGTPISDSQMSLSSSWLSFVLPVNFVMPRQTVCATSWNGPGVKTLVNIWGRPKTVVLDRFNMI